MAVLESSSNHYYRLNFDACQIYNGFVYVSVRIYNSIEDRNKEKLRSESFNLFVSRASALIEERREALRLLYEATTPDNTLITLSEDELTELQVALSKIQANFIKTVADEVVNFTTSENILELLNSCGLIPEFYNDPILIVSNLLVNCGQYNNEELTYEYYYDVLKTIMSVVIDV